MRSYVSNLILFPGPAPGVALAAAYTRGSTLVFTPSYFKLGVLFHEFVHILDTTALRSTIALYGYARDKPFSNTALWTRALANDSALPTPYARSTLQEDFADSGRWAMSDMISQGGLGEFSAGWDGCRSQIRAFEKWLGEVIFPKGGRCVGKMPGSEAVLLPYGNGKGEAGGKPAATLEGTPHVEKIVLPEWAESMLFVYRGPALGDW